MAYPNSQIRIREGKVTPVIISEDQLQELKKILEPATPGLPSSINITNIITVL